MRDWRTRRQAVPRGSTTAATNNSTVPDSVVEQMTRPDRFKELTDVDEYKRLYTALMSRFGFGNGRRQTLQRATAPRRESSESTESTDDVIDAASSSGPAPAAVPAAGAARAPAEAAA